MYQILFFCFSLLLLVSCTANGSSYIILNSNSSGSTGNGSWDITGSEWMINDSGVLEWNNALASNWYLNKSKGFMAADLNMGTFNIQNALTISATSVSATVLSGALAWTNLATYPAACSAGDFISAVGDTITCGTPTGGGNGTINYTFLDSVYLNKSYQGTHQILGKIEMAIDDLDMNNNDIIDATTISSSAELGVQTGGSLTRYYGNIHMNNNDVIGIGQVSASNQISTGDWFVGNVKTSTLTSTLSSISLGKSLIPSTGIVNLGSQANPFNSTYTTNITTDNVVFTGNLTTGTNAGNHLCIDANSVICICGSCA